MGGAVGVYEGAVPYDDLFPASTVHFLEAREYIDHLEINDVITRPPHAG